MQITKQIYRYINYQPISLSLYICNNHSNDDKYAAAAATTTTTTATTTTTTTNDNALAGRLAASHNHKHPWLGQSLRSSLGDGASYFLASSHFSRFRVTTTSKLSRVLSVSPELQRITENAYIIIQLLIRIIIIIITKLICIYIYIYIYRCVYIYIYM